MDDTEQEGGCSDALVEAHEEPTTKHLTDGTATVVAANNMKSQTDDIYNDSIKADFPSDKISGTTVVLKKPSSLSTKRKFFLGLLIVCLIAVSWVGGTQTAKSSFNTGFDAPFFIMYFSTAWMMLVFPLTLPLFFLSGKGSWDLSGLKQLWRHSMLVFSERGITVCSLLTSTVLFATIWAITNYVYARALINLAATDVTALFSSAPAFVFLFSICVLKEPPLVLRLISVLMVITGIVLFAYVDGFESASLVGVALSVGAAIGAACYKVLLKWRVGDASLYQMGLFLSTLGLFITIAFWPILLLLHFIHVERLEHIPWGFICAHSALGLLFNFSINFGIAYTFPLFISLGTVLGIPLNALVDVMIRHTPFFTTWKFTATDLIVGGFLLMLVPPVDSQWIHSQFMTLVTCGKYRKYSKLNNINDK